MSADTKHIFMLKPFNELSEHEFEHNSIIDISSYNNMVLVLKENLKQQQKIDKNISLDKPLVSLMLVNDNEDPLLISKEAELVTRACQYLTSHLCEKQTLDSISYVVGSNRSKLASAFKKVLGVGVFQWLRTQRLQKAQYLLSHSHLSIQDISMEVGYDSNANFSTAYKKLFGVSPREFRRNNESVN